MKTLKSTLLVLLVVSAFSCNKDDGDPIPDNPDNNGESSYSITLNGTEYSNFWDSEGEHEGQAIFSTYVDNSAGNKGLSLNLADEDNVVVIDAGLTLKNNGQPFPMSHPSEGWNESSEFSLVTISVGDKDYVAESGTATIANLETKVITGVAGIAAYDLEIEGSFNDLDMEEQGVQITATVHIQPNFIQ
ncbi:hypothetical protein [uncultured Marixanthomonas sp.]|uniref:hypothetical protein n=1 Tax=uncultured Marixanthomonas sp. TaxID=757245 RepID=UPI0030DA18D2|tara:strand:+ start:42267 stop:42833 length:567 start_codon:yes stop_codon:yes gene_type:complete